ncbi:MAG: RNA methyltransferase [Cellvibrionales bacterium]|nr:MAG: RNA methyltransferase [Cellvibrionales bacterium]
MFLPPRFILIETSHAGNVGAAARALKVMGFDDLVLVRPRWANVLRREETIQRASGANDVLAKCSIVENLDDALDGITHLCATAMTPRDFGPPTYAPREHFSQLAAQFTAAPESGQRLGILFGCERFGMKNEDVYRCHTCLSIPTNPQFGSLNLASAVQLLAYEWRLAIGGFSAAKTDIQADKAAWAAPKNEVGKLADAASVAGALAHWQEALVALDYLDPASPKKLMPRLQQLANRATLKQEEIHILRGIAKKILQSTQSVGS